MSSRLKERGGGGGKTMASKPNRAPIDSTPKDKRSVSATRRTPTAAAGGKENPRPLSSGKISAVRPNPPTKPVAAASVRWSTSSLPRSKPPNPSDSISDLRGDRRLPRVSVADQLGRALRLDLEAEAGSGRLLGGVRVSDRCQQGKGISNQGLKKSDDRLVAGISLSLNQNPKASGLVGSQVEKRDRNTLDMIVEKLGGKIGINAASEKRTRKEVVALEPVIADDDSSRGKVISDTAKSKNEGKWGNLNEKVAAGSGKSKVFQVTSSTSVEGNIANGVSSQSGQKGTSYSASNPKSQDRTAGDLPQVVLSDKKKDCIIIQSEISKEVGGSITIKDIPCEKVCAIPVVEVAQKPSANIRVFDKVKDDVVDGLVPRYPSKLHEKLAMLEGKVQKIASEIKRTKEMLDSNKPDDSKLILSEIQTQISGIEKAVAHTIDSTTSQLGNSKMLQADFHDYKSVVSVGTVQASTSGHSVKKLNREDLEARFFPHHKLLRGRRPSSASGDDISNHNDVELEDGPLSPIDESSIQLKFLASLSSEQAEANKYITMPESDHARVLASGSENSSLTYSKIVSEHSKGKIELTTNEELEEFDSFENRCPTILHVDTEEPCKMQLCEIGSKPTAGGWFVSEGEAVLLAHHDGSCSYYDIANYEFKAEYKSPSGVPSNAWGDCWLIRAPGADGCSGKYVVAASAGNALESGFCSWDYYTREVRAFCTGDLTDNSSSLLSSRMDLGSLSNANLKSVSAAMPVVGHQQWWYKPCGPLIISTASRQKFVFAHDIRDGDMVMKWEVNSSVIEMEYSSPLQWRSRGKVIIAGTEAISLWDVNSVNPQPLLSVACSGKKIYSLHVNNTDAELGGGVRQRVSSSEVEGNDGVFCTQDCINVLDFRLPAGVGMKVSRHGSIGHSIFSRGDSIFVGSTEGRLPIKGCPRSRVHHYSLRKGKLLTTYELPEFSSHFHHSSLTQVWGNANIVMGICGMGLYIFDALHDERSQAFCFDRGNIINVKETIGPDDLYCPTFDYSASRVLVISRDRPAYWRRFNFRVDSRPCDSHLPIPTSQRSITIYKSMTTLQSLFKPSDNVARKAANEIIRPLLESKLVVARCGCTRGTS